MANIKLHHVVYLFLLAAIILLIFIRPCGSHTVEKRTEVVHDTLFRDTIIYKEIKVPVPVEKLITVIDTHYIIDEVRDTFVIDTSDYLARYYTDTIYIDGGHISWHAATTGNLLALDATYNGRIAERIVYKPTPTGGLYIMSGIGYNGMNASAQIGASYITKKGKVFGYEYDFLEKSHNIKTGLRLFD